MATYTDTKIDLVLNHLSRERYEDLLSSDQLSANELYLVDEDYLDAMSAQVVNVADPVLSSDAANKNYVDVLTTVLSEEISVKANLSAILDSSGKILSNLVVTDSIADGSITSAKFAEGAVPDPQLNVISGYSDWIFTKELTEEQKAALSTENPSAADNDYALNIDQPDPSIPDYLILYVGNYNCALLYYDESPLCILFSSGSPAIEEVWQIDEIVAYKEIVISAGYVLGNQTDKPLAGLKDLDNLSAELSTKQDLLTEDQLNALSSVPNKLESSSAAPVFSTLSTYFRNDYVTYQGVLYRFNAAHVGDWSLSDVEIVDMTTPDATLDIYKGYSLRVVDAEGNILWQQGYNSSVSSSVDLSNETVNYYEFPVNSTSSALIIIPNRIPGKVTDLVLDVWNPPLVLSDSGVADFDTTSVYNVDDRVIYDSLIWKCILSIDTAGAWTGTTNWVEAYPYLTLGSVLDNEFNVVVPHEESLAEWFKILPGEMSEFYFTLTSFKPNGIPTYKIIKQIVDLEVPGGGA